MGDGAGAPRLPRRDVHFALENDGWNCTLECEVHVSAPGRPDLGAGTSRGPSGPAPRSARSSGNRRARHLTREHVPLADVLAGQVTCSRPGGVPSSPSGRRGARHGRRPSGGRLSARGHWRRRLSKSVAKARIEPGRARRNVDIPRFFSRPIPSRGAFATDLDTLPPRIVSKAPPAPSRQGVHPGAHRNRTALRPDARRERPIVWPAFEYDAVRGAGAFRPGPADLCHRGAPHPGSHSGGTPSFARATSLGLPKTLGRLGKNSVIGLPNPRESSRPAATTM